MTNFNTVADKAITKYANSFIKDKMTLQHGVGLARFYIVGGDTDCKEDTIAAFEWKADDPGQNRIFAVYYGKGDRIAVTCILSMWRLSEKDMEVVNAARGEAQYEPSEGPDKHNQRRHSVKPSDFAAIATAVSKTPGYMDIERQLAEEKTLVWPEDFRWPPVIQIQVGEEKKYELLAERKGIRLTLPRLKLAQYLLVADDKTKEPGLLEDMTALTNEQTESWNQFWANTAKQIGIDYKDVVDVVGNCVTFK
jgi:hypothetical protein